MTVHPKLADRTCYHKYEIEPGLFTPGLQLELDPKLCLDELGVPQYLEGLRALDIGAWDGPFTFELERRGAKVTALDIQDPDVTVFNAVKKIKNSSATYVRSSIYNALPEALGVFDVIFFIGVYYHLRNPMLALQRIRNLLDGGGILFIEGAATTDYLAEWLNEALGLPESSLHTTAQVLDQLPLSYFDIEHKIYGFSSSWYPTIRGLEAALLDSGAAIAIARDSTAEKSPGNVDTHGLAIGDTMELNDHRAVVVGICRVTRTWRGVRGHES